MRCKHNFVRSGYGNDLICTKCGYAAKQATLPFSSKVGSSLAMPAGREKVKMPHYTGSETVVIEVFRDDIKKELKRELGFDLTHNIMKNAKKL